MLQNKTSKFIHKILLWILSGGTLLFPIFVFPKTGESINLPKTFFLFLWVAVVILLWSVVSMIEKKLLVRRSMLDIPLLLFAFSILLGGIFSVSQIASFLGNTESFTLSVLTLFPAILFGYLLIQLIRTKQNFSFLLQSFFLSSIVVQVIFFTVQTQAFQHTRLWALFGENIFNTISSYNSIYGIWVAAMGILSFGFILLKGRKWTSLILPTTAAFLSLFTLFRLGFEVAFAVYAVGMGILLVLPFLFAKFIHVKVALTIFAVFLLTLVTLVFGDPKFLKMNAPVEIALGRQASGDIVQGVLQSDVKHFLFGSGPGTFLYDFSLYRTPAFNTNALVSTTRFHSPFSTIYALFAEVGVVGGIFFILIILIGAGALVSTWVELRSSWKEIMKERAAEVLDHPSFSAFAEMFQVFVIGAAWIALTVGILFSFVDLATWWTWWSFLGLIIVGIGFVNKKFVVERPISLSVSPQYSLALSFGIIFFLSLVILSTAFGVRMYLAEYYFTRSTTVTSLTEAEAYLHRSIEYRKSYAPYYLALARVHLQQAKQEFEKNKDNIPTVSALVVKGAEEAKEASQLDSKNVATWETLSLLYLNADAFAPEAKNWAKEGLQKALALEPSNALNHARLGDVYVRQNMIDEAEKEFVETIRLKFDYLPAYDALIQIYSQKQAWNDALVTSEALMKVTDPTPNILFQYGLLFFNRHEKEDENRAEEVWLDALKKEPKHLNTLYSLGLLYERKGDIAKALTYYQKVRELVPENQDVKKKIQSLVK